MKYQYSTTVTLAVCSILLLSSPVFAATSAAPASKCVTTKTQGMHASATAQMEKDIAAYAKTASAESAIQTYRQNMVTAWDAMTEPYCGFGSYGAASAVKSYSKSVIRARTAFLNAVKGKPAVAVVAASNTPKIVPAPVETKIPKATTSSASTLRGLHRGMESDAVLTLQKLLQTYSGSKDSSLLTGYFGPKTEKAVIAFQIASKLISDADAPGAGTIGPRTAAALEKL